VFRRLDEYEAAVAAAERQLAEAEAGTQRDERELERV
jgi:hypothetical protein